MLQSFKYLHSLIVMADYYFNNMTDILINVAKEISGVISTYA